MIQEETSRPVANNVKKTKPLHGIMMPLNDFVYLVWYLLRIAKL
jgi:hypothetical protein